MHIKGGALAYYDQLAAATRGDFDKVLAALRQCYVNPQRQDLKRTVFQSKNFKPDEETASDFLTELQRLATESLPCVAVVVAQHGRTAMATKNVFAVCVRPSPMACQTN